MCQISTDTISISNLSGYNQSLIWLNISFFLSRLLQGSRDRMMIKVKIHIASPSRQPQHRKTLRKTRIELQMDFQKFSSSSIILFCSLSLNSSLLPSPIFSAYSEKREEKLNRMFSNLDEFHVHQQALPRNPS